MEATLERNKPKKQRQKSKVISKNVSTDEDIKLQKFDLSKKIKESISDDKLVIKNLENESAVQVNSESKLLTVAESLPKEDLGNFKNDYKNVLPVSGIFEQSKTSEICDNISHGDTVNISLNETLAVCTKTDSTLGNVDVKYPTVDLLNLERQSLKSEKEIKEMEEHSLVRYPTVKCLQHCEKIHSIASSQVLVQTFTDKYQYKVAIEANKAYEEFIKETHNIEKHPLMDMIHLYQREKKNSSQHYSRIKYLRSHLKRNKDDLWITVKKEVYAKGKCDDGYFVNIKHTYTIKQLDELKFNEVVKNLKEIEELLLSAAFYSYSEELVKLRTEHYISNLIYENGKSKQVLKTQANLELSDNGENTDSLKKCISVLFDSQRQNVEDKDYLENCQRLLKILVCSLNQDENFNDNLFLINHIIRCPNGVKNWASKLIQVPINDCHKATEKSDAFECTCAERIILTLYLILSPVPLKDYFLRNIKQLTLTDCIDRKFTVLDSDGEEEETLEMSRNWSDDDIISLLNQIPVRSLFKHILLDSHGNADNDNKKKSEEKILKLFAYSTAMIDILCMGLETYYSENFPIFFETVSNLIRHILLYVSEYYTDYESLDSAFKSENRAIYDKLFFHVVFKIYNFNKFHVLKILPALPYNHVSIKVLWNILWIFFHPGRSEQEIYSEKDVEVKIKDECIQSYFLNHIKSFPTEDLVHLLNTLEKIIVSSNSEEDFVKFSTYLLFKITILDSELRKRLSIEGSIILSAVCEINPCLVSILLKEINDDDIASQSMTAFKKMTLSNWRPQYNDISIVSSWLLSNVTGERNRLARLILKKMNFDYDEKGSLFLPYDLHKRVAVLITEAYVLFDANNIAEGLISKGIKQMLQFTALGNYEDDREHFAHFAWSILFSLKLHPLDKKYPPLVQVYDGSIGEYDSNSTDSSFNFQPLLSAYESKHPAGCYLMIVMTNEGCSMKTLLKTGLECLQSLIENEQYMAAIKLLYYILPFFVMHPEDLLDKFGFLKAMYSLITADLTVISNITGEPVIGAVLHRIAAMTKYQIYKAGEHTIEFSAPLLKLWIKILMKMLHPSDKNLAYMSKNSAKQIYFLLDVLVKISFLHDYTRTSVLDLLDSYCSPHLLMKTTPSLLKRLFSSDSTVYPILNQNNIPEYPFLSYYVLLTEMKQKNVQDLWLKVETEMSKQNEGSPLICLQKVSDGMKVDLEFLPIYRWALQAVATPVSSAMSPLIYQQFFLYYFHQVQLPNSQSYSSIGVRYFKKEPFIGLLKKMKKHVSDTENHYKNLSKHSNKEPENIQASGSSANLLCDNEYMLHLNLLKCFKAFKLWIEDESLQDSKLCLSALEPKYMPSRLELVLKGDQNIWTDLVSVKSLKEEIDQKVHSFCLDKNVNLKEPDCIHKESLSNQIKRHLNNYETILPSLSYDPSIMIPTTCEEDHTSEPFSQEAIVQFIEQNQFIIFDKAKFFCEQIKKLKQLNFNFINLTPQEYDVEPCEITLSKVCYKGNTEKGCSGAAVFKLQIEKCTRNQRIAEKIENNRADYLIIHDQLSKLPLKDLCMASLRIENFIRSLAKKMRQDEDGKSDYFRKMGVALFYHQIRTIDKTLTSVIDFPPSRQFFSSIIESLGEEFIDGDESELMELAKSILNHPESGSLALPLFNPNKSSISNFLNVYETLTSSVSQQSANTLLALLSKIDFLQWLCDNAPNFDNRKKIFQNISLALKLCGAKPTEDILPVFEVIKRHFGIVLQYMFPDLFPEAVFLLLNGIEDQNLSLDVYYEAFHCFGCPLFHDKTSVNDIELTLRKFAEYQHLPADQQIFISVAQLSLEQVKQVSDLLYNHFMKKRLSMKNAFYKQYSSYIKAIGIFLAIISHSLISLHLDEVSSCNKILSLSHLWDLFHLPFFPWLHPTENASGLEFPWANESSLACYMFKLFIASLKYFHEKISSYGCEESVLSNLWNLYIQVYVKPGYRHYSVSVCHSELINLPWHQFHPSTQDIEGMCKVLQSNLDESKEFLSNISLKIPWSEVMQNISMTKSPDYVGEVLATLGKLLIISQLQSSKETESNPSTSVFKEFECLSWNFLCLKDVESLLNLFYDHLDPLILLKKFKNCEEFHVLQFLKLICCIVPNVNAKDYSNSKRILYLKKFLSAVSNCSISKKAEVQKVIEELKEILSGLLAEINDAICIGVVSNEQTNCALPLMKEYIIFLNSLVESEIDVIVVDSVISFLSVNKQSPLLLPCLKVSSSDLQSVSHMVPLIECCIYTRFTDESSDPYETNKRWQLISSYFCVPSHISEDFVKKCIEENAFLTLYCYVLRKLPLCNTTEKKIKMLQKIVQWVRDSNLSSSSEAKFLLIWDKILELSMKLVLVEEYQVVKLQLTPFMWILETLAEDRSNSGFFGIIGFGQSSSLSVNFRFLCRVMTAFIFNQIPENGPIRMEPTHVGLIASHSTCANTSESKSNNISDPQTSVFGQKALDQLKALELKKSYSALQSQISYAVQCVCNSKYTLMQSRELLKYFALILYPKDSYLAALDS